MTQTLGDILKTLKFTVTCACGASIEWDFTQPKLTCNNCGLSYLPNGEDKHVPENANKGTSDTENLNDK